MPSPSAEGRLELTARLVQRVRQATPKPSHNHAMRRTLFRNCSAAQCLDVSREYGVEAALKMLPTGREISSAQVELEQRSPHPVPAGLSVAAEEAEAEFDRRGGRSIVEISDDKRENVGFEADLTIRGPSTRHELRLPGHWQPLILTRYVAIHWLPEKSQWITPAERELARIACLTLEGLTAQEIADRMSLNVRTVQRRIEYLLSDQRDTEKIVATNEDGRT